MADDPTDNFLINAVADFVPSVGLGKTLLDGLDLIFSQRQEPSSAQDMPMPPGAGRPSPSRDNFGDGFSVEDQIVNRLRSLDRESNFKFIGNDRQDSFGSKRNKFSHANKEMADRATANYAAAIGAIPADFFRSLGFDESTTAQLSSFSVPRQKTDKQTSRNSNGETITQTSTRTQEPNMSWINDLFQSRGKAKDEPTTKDVIMGWLNKQSENPGVKGELATRLFGEIVLGKKTPEEAQSEFNSFFDGKKRK